MRPLRWPLASGTRAVMVRQKNCNHQVPSHVNCFKQQQYEAKWEYFMDQINHYRLGIMPGDGKYWDDWLRILI